MISAHIYIHMHYFSLCCILHYFELLSVLSTNTCSVREIHNQNVIHFPPLSSFWGNFSADAKRSGLLRSIAFVVPRVRIQVNETFAATTTAVRQRTANPTSRQRARMSTASNAFADAARSTAASGSAVYEGERAVHEYVQFHFGKPEEVLPHDCGPKQALGFTRRCADLCIEAMGNGAGLDGGSSRGRSSSRGLRAFDVGCSVGGITFELTRGFDEVLGLDYSSKFVEAADRMRVEGRMEYQCLEQGSVVLRREALLPERTVPSNASFMQGDACALDVETLGSFDAVLASNLLCRLPKPKSFLNDLSALVKPGGVAVLVSPYSWLAEYTPQSEWLGGVREEGGAEGEMVDSFDRIRELMEAGGSFKLEKRVPMPFLIREHARKFQWGCSDGTVWRRV